MSDQPDFSDFSSDAINSAVGQAYGKTIASAPMPTQPKPSQFAALYADAGKKYGVDPNILAGIAQTESSGNPNATSKDANGRPLAHGLMQLTLPTASSLGVTDPYDPAQAVDGAARLMKQNMDASGGDVTAALKMYHGGTNTANWGPKTNAYPAQVAANTPAPQNQAASFSDFNPSDIGAAVSSAYKNDSKMQIAKGDVYTAVAKKALLNTPQVGSLEAAANAVSGMVAAPISNIAGLAAAGYSTLTGDQGDASGFRDYVRNALTYEPKGDTGKAIAKYNPIAMAGQGWGLIGDAAGNAIKSANPGSGIVQGIGNATAEAIPQAIGVIGAVAAAPARGSVATPMTIADRIEPTLAKPRYKLQGGQPVPIDAAQQPAAPNTTSQLTGQFAQAKADQLGGLQSAGSAATSQASALPGGGGGAARATSNPYQPLTGQESVRGDFPQVKPSNIGADVPLAEQQQRAMIANQILGDVGQVRTGVVTGNLDALKNEQSLAKAPNPTPQGLILKQQFADEQNALSNYAKDRVDATGARPTLQNDYQRGQFVNSVVVGDDGLTGYFKELKQQVYDQAKATVGDNPIATTNLDALLSDPKFKAELKINGQDNFTSGLSDLTDVMKKSGFEGAAPNSVAAMEELRKYLNAQWTQNNKYGIGKAISAIDDDVSSAGGPGLYEQARAIHQTEKSLFNSKGIKSLFGDVDPNGVQTATPFEKIPDKLNNMPIDQWSHVHNMLDSLSRGQIPGAPENMPSVPTELQQAAAQARNEVNGMLARKVYESGADKAGVWNQNAANKTLNSTIGDKIKMSMPPNEVDNFHTLNLGGQIMPGEIPYEGAGNQLSRMANQGFLERHAGAAGALIGSKLGPAGTWIGTKVGEKISNNASASRLAKQAAALTEEIQSNSKMGGTSLYDISNQDK